MDRAAENKDFPPWMETAIYGLVGHSDCWSIHIPEKPSPLGENETIGQRI